MFAGGTEILLRLCCAALLLAGASAAAYDQDTTTVQGLGPVLTGFDHFAKPVSRGILTGGRPQSRDLASLASAGVKSIVSIFQYGASEEWRDVRGDWLSSAEQISATRALGINATHFNSTFDLASVLRVSDAIIAMPKPIYVHCHVGWTADLFAQLHLIRVGAADPSEFYNDTRALGWDFQASPAAISLVDHFGGPRLPVSHPDMGKYQRQEAYYWAHRLGDEDKVSNSGQPLQSHVAAISKAGYMSVVSFRSDGEPTVRLPSDPSSGVVHNLEFSDSNGNWNATAERASFEQAGLHWMNLPVTGEKGYTVGEFEVYEPLLKRLPSPILSHCASGHKSSVYMLAYEGKRAGNCVPWALQKAAEVGFHLDQDAEVLSFWQTILGC